MKNIIKIERALKSITQKDLAKTISVSRQIINAMKVGKHVPSKVLALKIAKYFGKNVEEILVLEDGDYL